LLEVVEEVLLTLVKKVLVVEVRVVISLALVIQ
jgi:hypothetical protein